MVSGSIELLIETIDENVVSIKDVKKDSTVSELKQVIEERTGIHVSDQRLIYLSKDLENFKSLSFYNIQHRYTINLITRTEQPPVFIQENVDTPMLRNIMVRNLQGKTVNVDKIPQNATVGKLLETLTEKASFEVPQGSYIRLIWSGKQLVPEKTLEHYGIKNDSTIHAVARLRGGDRPQCLTGS